MKQILDYHQPLIEKNGVLNAHRFSCKGQLDRFDIILEQMHFRTGDRVSVLDYGCGVGDFSEYLTPPTEYIGIDINPQFIEAAKKKFQQRKFICGCVGGIDPDKSVFFPDPFDFVIASGIFCYDLGPDTLKAYRSILAHLWSMTKDSLFFNVLRSSKNPENKTFTGGAILSLIPEDCKRWSIIADYRENDATIVLRK